jgi:TM2 domain-containing membrane protein YozV
MAKKKKVVKSVKNPAPSSSGKKDKNWLTALLLSIFLGYFGVDRFYMGYVGTGILKLLVSIVTLGTCAWIWWIIDIILIAVKSPAFKTINWTQ